MDRRRRRKTNLDGILKLIGGIVVIIGFLIFVLPGVLALNSFVSQGYDADPQQGVELITDLSVNWWVPLAISDPYVFLILVLLFGMIGAEAVLEM